MYKWEVLYTDLKHIGKITKYDRGILLVFKWFQKTYHAPLQFSNANEAANVTDAFVLLYPPIFIVRMFHMNDH